MEYTDEWLDVLQCENHAWVQRNFSPQPAHQPLLGFIEELGEMEDSILKAHFADAVGDIYIYLANFCNSMQMLAPFKQLRHLHQVADGRPLPQVSEPAWKLSLICVIGRLCHAFLKMEQGIRGSSRQHIKRMELQVVEILRYVQLRCVSEGVDVREAVTQTWAQVRQRNWRCGEIGCRAPLSNPSDTACPLHVVAGV